jgi:hypothetical protein
MRDAQRAIIPDVVRNTATNRHLRLWALRSQDDDMIVKTTG